MNAHSSWAMPSARAATPTGRSRQAVSGKAGIPIAAEPANLSAYMREERIRDVHFDPLLDRFCVTLIDYSIGLGGSVGAALVDAKRRAA